MKSSLKAPLFVLVMGIFAARGLPAVAGQTLSYADLVQRMTDLARLAVLPEPGDTCAQWSSYDRASRYDAATGKYVRWDANGDGTGIIRKEGQQSVLAEMQGPGCIWRIWSALAEKGHVKIFLDGQNAPVVDLAFSEYFDGQHAPFAWPQLSYDLKEQGCRGQNLYLPIPYQKSCKVVADEGWGRYFHFTYETFPQGTQVPTFSPALAAQHTTQIGAVDAFLAQKLGTDPAGPRPGQETLLKSVHLAPGEKLCVASLAGPRAISGVRVRASFKDRDDEMAALRRVALQMTWDGQPQPAVWCPLGDFFGTAPGVNKYKSLPTGMTDDGFYSYWYMPFEKSGLVELINEDQQPRQVEIELVHAPLGRPFAGLGHFHLKWHRDTVKLPDDRWPDWVMLQAEGRGRFCGVMLHVWNPRGGWWGEGDEKFFVDGEKFPSTFGTGSEDYFGYAWCHPHLFQRAYHDQTMSQNNRGHQSVLRWHIVDNVPFQRSIETCIEKYYKTAEKGTQYALTTAWYLAPGGRDPYGAVPVAERDGYYTVPEMVAAGFKVIGFPRGDVRTQSLAHFRSGKWRNDEQLWWTGAKPKDTLSVAVPVTKAGRYEVSALLTKARDYGIVELSLDGQPCGGPIDLYNLAVIPSGPIALGVHTLTAGEHKLTVRIVGANPAALPSYMFGLSEVKFSEPR